MPAVADWYHCRVKPVSRSAGRSVIAAAAYRLGERLVEHGTSQTHDYTRRSGVESTFAVIPDHAPEWARDPETLWNAAATAEKRRNSTLARECELALPAAVGKQERQRIAWGFAQHLVDRYGVAASVAIHQPSRHGSDLNYHAHILFTTRRMGEDGLGEKTRELDARATGPQEILYLRQYACDLINASFERSGLEERVDHRSFEARGIEREATEHLGPTASDMERKGENSERGDRNREIRENNRQMDELVQELADLNAALAAEQERRLDEQYGLPDAGPDTSVPDRDRHVPEDAHAPEPEAQTAFQSAAERYAAMMAEALRWQQEPQPWTAAEFDPSPSPAPGTTKGPDTRTWRQRAEEYAANWTRQISERGEITWRDGFTWYERAVQVLGTVRGQVADWASGRWKSFVDFIRDDRDNPRDGPDMDR